MRVNKMSVSCEEKNDNERKGSNNCQNTKVFDAIITNIHHRRGARMLV